MRGKDALLRRRLAPLEVTPEIHVYPGAGHSFLTDGHHPLAARVLSWPLFRLGYGPAAAEDAWPKILAFFARTLLVARCAKCSI